MQSRFMVLAFFSEVSRQGSNVCVAKANASNPEDKRHILRLIIGEKDPDAEPPASHTKYDEVNHAIHKIFAPRALFQACLDGCIQMLLAS